MERTQVMLSLDSKNKLKEIAKKRKISMGKVARIAIDEYVDKKTKKTLNAKNGLLLMAENAVTPKHDYFPHINSSNFRKYLPELLD